MVTVTGQIGIIKINRPKSLNSFNRNVMVDIISAMREFNDHPDTIFTVLTGEGRFFSSGIDIKGLFVIIPRQRHIIYLFMCSESRSCSIHE